ncbi:SepM family pheromone-processing serine protease [Bacillus sp. PS06]|uniref:SepM family pheromone-processing serine protease n=1 Tax=Bacillus sp. PS06 TaxID=2764176 RepID=UPI00177ECE8A|nr:SepM family pheromone-processing serine protease [Bacillus sp. PS06]MBD8068408.1 PDZ domain-containing protein [Bacillus sp. PS06]
MNKSYFRILTILVGIVVILTFVQLPYYITKPGMAQELHPIIQVEDGYGEEGSFMLTTVRMGKANIFTYLYAKMSEFHMIYPTEDIRREGESDSEYTNRQLHLMEDSQESAVIVAFHHANKKVDYKYNGIYVMSIVAGMPAEGKLKPGDRIYEVDGKQFHTSDEFIEYVSTKEEGEEIQLTIERDGSERSESISISPFPDDPKKVGVGIALVTDREVTTEPEVKIDTEQIGGPSAGLMFSLEIYNQLVEEDITNGYQIAGTGSIDDTGKVGRIGGISQKIVAADSSGVDIFFAPNEEGAKGSNYNEAVATAKKIKSEMKIVPVDTFSDAREYLESIKK